MGDTRKQIIEIIGDYMDKTLSEGCLFNTPDNSYQKVLDENEIGEECAEGIGELAQTYFTYKDEGIEEILGHYDTTAVLNFIVSGENVMNISRIQYDKEFGNYITVNLKNREQFNIRMKPLYLYTEQEDEELLELLLKLK